MQSIQSATNDIIQHRLKQRPALGAFANMVGKSHVPGLHNGKIKFFRRNGDPTLGVKAQADGANITVLASGVYRIAAGATGTIQFGGPNTALSRNTILERIRIAIKASGGTPYVPVSSPQPLMLVNANVTNGSPQLIPGTTTSNVGNGTIERFLVGTPAGYGAPSDGAEDDEEPLAYIDATNGYVLTIANFDAVNPVDFTVDGSVA